MASRYLRGGTYWIKYYQNGKPVYKSLKTKDLSAAKFLQNKIENELLRGSSPLPDSSRSAAAVLAEFLLDCKNRLTERAYYNIKSANDRFMDFAKPGRITDISLKAVNEYLRHRSSGDTPVSQVTLNHDIKHIKQFINYAVRQNYLADDPLKNLRKVKPDKTPPRYLSKDEIKKVMEAAEGTIFYAPIVTGLYTGMRYGELMNLQWRDVDLAGRQIVVRKAKSRQFRAIPMHDQLIDVLRPLAGPPDAKCFSRQNQQKAFRAILRNAEIVDQKKKKQKIEDPDPKKRQLTGVGWHTLRHTFASQLVMSGVDILTVSKLLGHADVKVTMIYAHLSRDHIAGAVQKLQF